MDYNKDVKKILKNNITFASQREMFKYIVLELRTFVLKNRVSTVFLPSLL